MKAQINDTLVNLSVHPIGWPLSRISRKLGRVMKVPWLGTVVNDASFGHEILVDDSTFTKNGEGSISATMTDLLGPLALGNMDGESHRQLRAKLRDVLSPSHSQFLLNSHRSSFDSLRNDLDAGVCVDLVDWMRVLSGRLTFDMLGVSVPSRDAARACREIVLLGERIASGIDFRTPDKVKLALAKANCETLADYARQGYESPTSSPTSLIRRLRDNGLTFDEAKGVLSLVFLAGTLTTAAALPRIVALLIDSNALPLVDRPGGWVAAAIAEGLRYVAPVPATMRIAQRDVTVQGRKISKGEKIIILTCNLGRDPELFDHPDRFLPERRQPARARNLWYGAGPHFCLGFALAQQQLHMVLETLTAGSGGLRIVSRKYGRRTIVPSYQSLIIRQ